MRLVKRLHRWLFGSSCGIYVCCRMTGRDKAEMNRRAHFVCEVAALHGIHAYSPVLEEKVKDEPGKLVNHDKHVLENHWKRDKEIIRYEARVVLLDHGEMKSLGMEREYCLSRGVLWKPTVMIVPKGTPLSVAQFEDDAIFYGVHEAMAYIAEHWGSRWAYWGWRLKMLNRTLLRWLSDQAYQWVV